MARSVSLVPASAHTHAAVGWAAAVAKSGFEFTSAVHHAAHVQSSKNVLLIIVYSVFTLEYNKNNHFNYRTRYYLSRV